MKERKQVPEVEVVLLALVEVGQVVSTGREGHVGVVSKKIRHSETAFFCLLEEVGESAEGEFLVGFEGLASTLRIGLAVGRPCSQNH